MATVLVVIGFCLVQQVLLEGPILAFRIAPEQTPIAIDRAKAWAIAGLVAIGVNELL